MNTKSLTHMCVLFSTVLLITACSNNRTSPSSSSRASAQPPPAVYQTLQVQVPSSTHKIELVSEGMTKDEIRYIMGQPDKISDMCCTKDKPKIWSYEGVKCFDKAIQQQGSQIRGQCEIHFDKESNQVVGWDKKRSNSFDAVDWLHKTGRLFLHAANDIFSEDKEETS